MARYGDDVLDPTLNRALAEWNRRGEHGHNWSVGYASQQLIRLGARPDVDTTKVQVWEIDADAEVLLTPNDGNLIDTVSSSSILDVGNTIRVFGSAFDDNDNLVRIAQDVTLNGRNKVTLPTPIARCCEMNQTSFETLAGDVYLYQDTAITNGVPSDLAKVAINILGSAGKTRSFKAGCVVAGDESLAITGGTFAGNTTRDRLVDFSLEWKPVSASVWQTAIGTVTVATDGSPTLTFQRAVVEFLPPNSDIRIMAQASGNNVPVYANMLGHYAKQIH